MRIATFGAMVTGLVLTIMTVSGCDLSSGSSDSDPASFLRGAPDYFSNTESYEFNFALPDLEGNTVSKQDFAGKILVVDIWGTWCPPCRAEIPDLVSLQKEYESQGVQFIGITDVNADTLQAAIDEVNDFTRRVPINYPLVFGTQETYLQVPHFEVFPTKVLIGRDGKVRRTEMGGRPEAFLRSAIEDLLAEDASSTDTSGSESESS